MTTETQMPAHTPGPWHLEERHGGLYIIGPDGDDIFHLCDDARYEANKRLMAASPDLLAAAEAALAHVRELEDAWMRGALSEHDGKGGTRSNRNTAVRVELEKIVAKSQGEGHA